MSIKYAGSNDPVELKKLAADVEKFRLFHRNGSIKWWLANVPDIVAMSVAYNGVRPIGVGIQVGLVNSFGCNIGFYVRTAWRRRGIGTKLYSMVKQMATGRDIRPWRAEKIADRFYRSVLDDKIRAESIESYPYGD